MLLGNAEAFTRFRKTPNVRVGNGDEFDFRQVEIDSV